MSISNNTYKTKLELTGLVAVDSKQPTSPKEPIVKKKQTLQPVGQTRTKVKCYINKGVIPNSKIALAQIQYELWDYLEDAQAFCEATFSEYEIREFRTLKILVNTLKPKQK